MRLVIDANILVAELLRVRGRALMTLPTLYLTIAGSIWDETEYELRKHIAHLTMRGTVLPDVAERLLESALLTVNDRLGQIPVAAYGTYESIARSRIPRDPDDWHTVALALASDADIWTSDADFLGCGVATWTTDTLRTYAVEPKPTMRVG